MSFMPEHFCLTDTDVAELKHDFLGSGPLLTGAGLLGCPPSPLLGGHCSPSNSSQSDTATTADAPLSLGSTAAADAAAAAATDAGGCRHTHSTKHGAARSNPTNQGLAAAAVGAGTAGFSYDSRREWLYRLVTFPHYFTPCHNCCGGNNTPKREQLMTLFDTRTPHRVFCCHCPTPKGSTGHFSASHGRDGALLQVRRSSFKNAVNATDICRFGADLGGVQQYTLNGNKIIYLAREASAKKPGHGAPPPASCTVDGRAMMDKNSLYCSLMCKMQAEDPGFTNWLDSQDPSVRIMAQVAANAPPVPTVACKRTYYSSGGRDSSSSPKSSGSNGSGSSSALKESAPTSVYQSPEVPPQAPMMVTTNAFTNGAPMGLQQQGAAASAAVAQGFVAAAAAAGGSGFGTATTNVFSSAAHRSYPSPAGGPRPTKVARLTAAGRSSSAPLTFPAAGSNGGGFCGSSGNDALLLGMATGGRSSSGALLEGLTSRPVARQLLGHGPDAAAVEAAARQAAVAAAAAAFSGAGTSAAAAAARDALGAAGLAPIRTGNGSPVYSSITAQQRQQQLQAAAAAAAGQQGKRGSNGASAAAAAAAVGSNTGGYRQLAMQQQRAQGLSGNISNNISNSNSNMRPESPKAPGLGSDCSSFGAPSSTASLAEPFLPGTEVPSSIPALGTGLQCGFQGVGGLLDLGFSGMGEAPNPAPWGSVGDIAGMLGVSDSSSPMHPGLDGLDAFFGDGSLSPAPHMLF